VADNKQPVEMSAGVGPGDEYATIQHWLGPMAFLGLLTVGLLCALVVQWPCCEESSCANARSKPVADDSSSASHPAPPAAATTAPATPAAPAAPAADAGAPASAPASASAPPPALAITSIAPTSGSLCGGTMVTIQGTGLSAANSSVHFGGLSAKELQTSADGTSLTATTPQHWEGVVDLKVSAANATVTLGKAFNYICHQRTQDRLLLLVMLAGALGGTLHALRSLFYYIGMRMLRLSWLPMYLALPLTGASISTVFFLVFVGGFFSPQGGDGQSFFLMVGVSALVGMFSPQAVEKLKKISEAILTSAPPAADSRPELILRSVEPAEGPQAGKFEVVLAGSGFASGATVQFDGVNVPVQSFSSTRITLQAPPRAAPGAVDVEITNPDGSRATKPSGFKYI
jgi:hypothetical protein